MAHRGSHEALTSQLTEAAARLLPRGPREAGVPSRELALEDVEGAQLLGNEAQPVLSAVGFSAVAIREWADAFFVRQHEGDVGELIMWIAERQQRSEAVRAQQSAVGGR